MKHKIHILVNNEARMLGLYYGFWNWFFIFKKELAELSIKVEFFYSMNEKFFEADHLFLNSRSIPTINNRIDLVFLKKISAKNKNLYWFDMRDSAGTTQFEVLPYVKKYIKKQFYKTKDIYFQKIEGGRCYTDYYIKKNKIQDTENYNQELLTSGNISKLILGWNIGVAFFFDYVNFSKIDYYIETIKFRYFKSNNYRMILPNYENWIEDSNKYDFFSLMNTNFSRNSVGFQRKMLKKILRDIKKKEDKIIEGRLSKKKYYLSLRNSKVSVGAFGWGEVCYREFEAIKSGTAFMTADMSNIETWPNIYHEDQTYLPYNFDFENLIDNLNRLVNDINLRKMLVNNSKDILQNCHSSIGRDYFIKKILEIIK